MDKKEQQRKVINKALDKVESNRYLWITLACIQLVLGIITLSYLYGALLIIMAIINFIKAHDLKNKLEEYKRNPRDMVSHYEALGFSMYIFISLHFIFGAGIGAIGIAHELSIKHYILKNREFF